MFGIAALFLVVLAVIFVTARMVYLKKYKGYVAVKTMDVEGSNTHKKKKKVKTKKLFRPPTPQKYDKSNPTPECEVKGQEKLSKPLAPPRPPRPPPPHNQKMTTSEQSLTSLQDHVEKNKTQKPPRPNAPPKQNNSNKMKPIRPAAPVGIQQQQAQYEKNMNTCEYADTIETEWPAPPSPTSLSMASTDDEEATCSDVLSISPDVENNGRANKENEELEWCAPSPISPPPPMRPKPPQNQNNSDKRKPIRPPAPDKIQEKFQQHKNMITCEYVDTIVSEWPAPPSSASLSMTFADDEETKCSVEPPSPDDENIETSNKKDEEAEWSAPQPPPSTSPVITNSGILERMKIMRDDRLSQHTQVEWVTPNNEEPTKLASTTPWTESSHKKRPIRPKSPTKHSHKSRESEQGEASRGGVLSRDGAVRFRHKRQRRPETIACEPDGDNQEQRATHLKDSSASPQLPPDGGNHKQRATHPKDSSANPQLPPDGGNHKQRATHPKSSSASPQHPPDGGNHKQRATHPKGSSASPQLPPDGGNHKQRATHPKGSSASPQLPPEP